MKSARALGCTRAKLAYLALFSLVAFGVLLIFYGASLNGTQIALLGVVITAVAGEVKSGSSFFFDGTPPKPEQVTATSPTTDTKEPA